MTFLVDHSTPVRDIDHVEPIMLSKGLEFSPGYRLDSFLGSGQFGQVWRIDAPGGTQLAVKFINLSDGQWEKEYKALKRVMPVRHPNLMSIISMWLLGPDGKALLATGEGDTVATIGSSDPTRTLDYLQTAEWTPEPDEVDWFEKHGGTVKGKWLAISMLLAGKSLLDRLKECTAEGLPGIPPKELIRLTEEAAKGLDYLNSAPELGLDGASLQHCDVKPANIVLLGGSAVVCDFGLAGIMEATQATQTSIAGTPSYMSPETANGKTSRNSDQYSLAITYYHLRTGKLPFSDGTVWQVLDFHRTGNLRFDDVSEAERQVLSKATALDWRQRYDSNLEMAEALRDALRPTPLLPPTDTESSSPDNRRRVIGLAALAGTAVLILAIVIGAWSSSQSSSELAPDPNRPPRPEFAPDPDSDGDRFAAGNSRSPAVTATPLDTEPWNAMLESTLTAPDEAIERFQTLLAQHPTLDRPLPLSLVGHQQELEQAIWLAADPSRPADRRPHGLITRALDPFIVRFDLTNAGESLLANQAAVADSDGQIEYREVELDPPGQRRLDHSPFIASIDISTDQSWGLSGGLDGDVRVWTTAADEPTVRAEIAVDGGDIDAVLWHPSGDYLLFADADQRLHLGKSVPGWPVSSSPEIAAFPLPQRVTRMAFDRWGESLVLLDVDGLLSTIDWKDCQRFLLNRQTPPPIRPLSTSGVRAFRLVDADAAAPVVFAAGQAGEVTVYSLLDAGVAERIEVISSGPVIAFAVADQGDRRILLSGGDRGELTLHRAGRGEVLLLPGHRDSVTGIAVSPDGQWAASVSRDGQATFRRLDDRPDRFVEFAAIASGSLTLVAWDPAGRWLLTGGTGGQVSLWDTRHLRLLLLEHPQTETRPPNVEPQPKPQVRPPDGDQLSRRSIGPRSENDRAPQRR